MRSLPVASMFVVAVSACATCFGQAGFHSFVQNTERATQSSGSVGTYDLSEAPPVPAPETAQPAKESAPHSTEGHQPHTEHAPGHEAHGEHGHAGDHHADDQHGGHGHDEHGHGDHGAHHEHHHHAHHAHHEHEEPVGDLFVMPYVRDFVSDRWDAVFNTAYGVNVGTVFWQPRHHVNGLEMRVGLLTEFSFMVMEGRDNTSLNSALLSPILNEPPNRRVDHAEMYAGNIGLAFEWSDYFAGSCDRWTFGLAPILTVGNINSDLEPDSFDPRERQFFIDRRPSDNGRIVNGDLRGWLGIEMHNGLRAGINGFYGIGTTDAVFGDSKRINSIGGGVYIDIPTEAIPHEFPAVAGTFQWIEVLFGLH